MNHRYSYILNKIEYYGNKIPHPFWIFNLLFAAVLLLSKVFAGTMVFESMSVAGNLYIRDLFTIDYLLYIIGDLDQLFISYRPLSVVLLVLMGVSVFQGSGAISAIIRSSSKRVPVKLLVAFAAFIAINSNIASDVAVILIPTLMAALYQSMNIHPWMGIIVGYAAVNGAWSFNMFIAGTDVITSEITNFALEQNHISYRISPFSNWIFMFLGSLLLVFITVLVSEKITKKTLDVEEELESTSNMDYHILSSGEKQGMKYLKIFVVIYFVVIILLYRWQELMVKSGHDVMGSMLDNIVGFIFLFFVLAGLAFGIGSRSIRGLNDLPDILSSGISGASVFIVTVLPAAVFIQVLNDSNIGQWMGVSLSQILINVSLPPLIVLILFIILVALLNLFLVSGSVKWMILAPIILPVFMQLNISPEMSQLAYRIGDSVTNCITPVDVYLSVIINLMILYRTDYDSKIGIGTVISLTLPYTIAYSLGLLALFTVFYTLGLGIGF